MKGADTGKLIATFKADIAKLKPKLPKAYQGLEDQAQVLEAIREAREKKVIKGKSSERTSSESTRCETADRHSATSGLERDRRLREITKENVRGSGEEETGAAVSDHCRNGKAAGTAGTGNGRVLCGLKTVCSSYRWAATAAANSTECHDGTGRTGKHHPLEHRQPWGDGYRTNAKSRMAQLGLSSEGGILVVKLLFTQLLAKSLSVVPPAPTPAIDVQTANMEADADTKRKAEEADAEFTHESLDEEAKDAFVELLLKECHASGASLLFVSHDRTLEKHFDRTVELDMLNGCTV